MTCPNYNAITREIDELVASTTRITERPLVVASATIQQHGGAFVLDLSVHERETTRNRQLDAPNCEELAHAAALVVAIAIDPTLLERNNSHLAFEGVESEPQSVANVEPVLPEPASRNSAPVASPSTATRPAPPRPPAIVTPAPYASSTSRRKAIESRFGFGAIGTLRVLPQPRVATAVMGAIQRDSLRLELWGSALAANAWSKQFDERGATFELYRLSPRFCWLVASTDWSVGPCAGGEIGLLSARGFGMSGVSTKTVSWLGSTLGASFDWRFAQVALLGLTADLGIPMRKYRFELAGEALYRRELSGSLGVYLAAGWQ